MNITLDPEIIHQNGTIRTKVTARDRDAENKIIYADIVTLDSATSRNRFAKALASITNQDVKTLVAQLIALLNQKLEPAKEPEKPSQDSLLSQMPEAIRSAAMDRLKSPLLFTIIKEDIVKMGVIGERSVAMGTYITGTSRLLEKPLAAIVRGATSAGKSYGIMQVAKLFPAETKLEAHHLSAKSLYYMADDALVHRFVIGGERPRRMDDEASDATKALREMISDGVLRCAVAENVDGKMTTTMYEKPGPIAFIETTSAANIFAEDENRCLVFHLDESEEQTQRIIEAAALSAASVQQRNNDELIQIHHAMQRMLRPLIVVIPFAPTLAKKFPTQRVEARRAMPHLLGAIKAVALLRQFQKTIINGTIQADVRDYEIALDIIRPTMERLAGGFSQQVARVWDAICAKVEDNEDFTRNSVAVWAGIRESDAGGRIRILVEAGYLVETQEHRGTKPAKFMIAVDMKNKEIDTGQITLPTAKEISVGMPLPENSDRQGFQPVNTERLSVPDHSGPTTDDNLSGLVEPCRPEGVRAQQSHGKTESKPLSDRDSAGDTPHTLNEADSVVEVTV